MLRSSEVGFIFHVHTVRFLQMFFKSGFFAVILQFSLKEAVILPLWPELPPEVVFLQVVSTSTIREEREEMF